jgi:hypothetical protein
LSALALLIAFAAAGCGSGSSSANSARTPDAAQPPPSMATGEAQPGCAELDVDPTKYDATFELGRELAASDEIEICAVQQTGDKDIWLNSTDVRLSAGSHHGLLWQTAYTTLPEADSEGDPIVVGQTVPCPGGANGRFKVTRPLAGSQGRVNGTGVGAFPKDVAMHVPAHSYVVLDLHMLNATDRSAGACMKVGIHGIPKDRVKQEGGVLFFYNPFITVAAGQSAHARMACPVTRDISLGSAVSHMHKSGVGYEAKWLDGDPLEPGTQLREMLYTTTQWDEPIDTVWPTPRALKAGDFIDYTCEYQNQTSHDVAQGLGTNDEMCMFVGSYWPYDEALQYCARPGTGFDASASAGYSIGSGELDGPGFKDCVLNANYDGGAGEQCSFAHCKNYPARYAWQACFTRACPAIGRYTRAYLDCLADNGDACKQQCNTGPAGCALDCIDDKCKTETAALMTTPCE